MEDNFNLADADDIVFEDSRDSGQRVEEGKKVEVEIVGQGKQGDGIAYLDGYTIFVKNAPLGTKLKVKIINVKDRNVWAEPVKKDAVPQEEVRRVYIPQKNELFGIVTQRLGFKRMYVLCEDGKVRVTRTPGRKRRLWIREGDIVVVKPWSVQGDEKADVIHKYRVAEVEFLRKRKLLEKLDNLNL